MPNLPGGNALPALLAAALWGIGDFSGGMGVRGAGGTSRAALRFIVLSHAASLVALATAAVLTGDPPPMGDALGWGLAAGVAVGLALAAFYLALARGTMGASAAISGLLAAAIPSAVSAGLDGFPGGFRLVGFAVVALAIFLIGSEAGPSPASRSTLLLVVGSGVGFGLYFVALRFASPAGVLWPLATARVGSLLTCGPILLAMSRRSSPAAEGGAGQAQYGRLLPWVLLSATFDTTGNLFFVSATRAGRLDVAAVLGSLYPASTILLAALVLREWPTRRQTLGMAVALVAVVLVTL